jgi:LmbE family N-acetylglucosaminyl deacetylase
MRITTVGAHQDDMEVMALGTILRFQERAALDDLTIVCLTNGDKGSTVPVDRAEFAATRAHEAEAVAAAIGGRYVGLGEEDEYLFDSKEIRERLVRVLREARPDLILCTPTNDYNTDHSVAGQIAIQSALLASVGSICPELEPLPSAPAMYEWDTVSGIEFVPTVYVDTTTVHRRKLELLSMHESQVVEMSRLYRFGTLDQAEIVGRFRGLQASVEYAEGFRPVLAWPRARPGVPLP